MARTRLRIFFGADHSLGPGKIGLLEAVKEHGSISAAARSMEMAYRHAWDLLDDMNRCFDEPVVQGGRGGRAGGGATVTPFGEEVIKRFRSMERRTAKAISADLVALDTHVCD